MPSAPAFKGALLDCDYIIALAFVDESTHTQANQIRHALEDIPQYVMRPILYELATTLSRKFGQVMALKVMKDLQVAAIEILEVEPVESTAWDIFSSHRRKSTSFFDCANLAAAKHYGFKIASFDRFYPFNLRLA